MFRTSEKCYYLIEQMLFNRSDVIIEHKKVFNRRSERLNFILA